MPKPSPTLIIFAGANGSGKSTLAKEVLPYAKIKEFVNADEIARGLSPFNPEGQKFKAGKLVLSRIAELIQKKESFAFESTFSGHTFAAILENAKKRGYDIRLFYTYTGDVNINITRIKNRVAEGGHGIPTADVRRRYKRSLYNLFRVYFGLCDTIQIYDTSGSKENAVAFKIGNDVLVVKDNYKIWKRMNKEAKVDV